MAGDTTAPAAESLYPPEPILVVDDDAMVLQSTKTVLASDGYTNTFLCHDSRDVQSLLDGRRFSAVILDLDMPHIRGMDLLPTILQAHPEIPVLVVTGLDQVETAVQCMRSGAFDYVVKPFDGARLSASLKHAIEQGEIRGENRRLRDSLFSRSLAHPHAFEPIVTRSAAMHTIFRYIEAIATTTLPILVTGETGVGKELVAGAIHAASGRTGPFVAVSAAGLDDTLFSDALFGHLKGAFTDAGSGREGMIARAAGGSLFLDEIGDLSAESQIKILRLLQEKEYYRLGSDLALATDARFIFATNRNLETLVAEGKFRHDLFYRLQSHRIHLPPLRERREDIPLLVDHFLLRASGEIGKKSPHPPPELYTLLQTYGFPGNVRELEGLIADAVVRHESGTLALDQVKEALRERMSAAALTSSVPGQAENPFTLLETLPPLSRANSLLIKEALHRSGGNQTLAAHLLGMSRTTLNKRLRKKPSQ